MIEQLTINEGKQVATGFKKDGTPWQIFVYQTSGGECKSFVKIDPETTAQFETEMRNSKPYKGQTKPEKWINKFTGSIDGYSAPKKASVSTGMVGQSLNPATSGLTSEDRQMIRETFEMVKAMYDESHPT